MKVPDGNVSSDAGVLAAVAVLRLGGGREANVATISHHPELQKF